MSAALDRLARAERQFMEQRFLAPVVRDHPVQVRIAGVRCTLKIEPADFEGWGIFQPLSYTIARLEKPATLAERRQYLELFPAVSLILGQRLQRGWVAAPAGQADARFSSDKLVPVSLVEGAAMFDSVRARYDGSQFWFEGIDERADPAVASHLREAIAQDVETAAITRVGLGVVHKAIYVALLTARREARVADERTRAEYRLRTALEHAGADFRDFAERDDVFSVTYEVDGARHTSIVQKQDLTVASAGICLSGLDRDFDLASLVGVLREGSQY